MSSELQIVKNEVLLTEQQAIERLALGQRPNPQSSLRWLMRTGKLPYVKLARGVYSFRPNDIQALIDACLVTNEKR